MTARPPTARPAIAPELRALLEEEEAVGLAPAVLFWEQLAGAQVCCHEATRASSESV